MNASFKLCLQCGQSKPLSEFSRDKQKKDGLRSYCKPCDRVYHYAHKERRNAYAKARYVAKGAEDNAKRRAKRGYIKPTPESRFWNHVQKAGDDDCWLWTAKLNSSGYGSMFGENRKLGAHVFAWELFNGPVPRGMYVLHVCDNRSCCNPKHMFLGTQEDNMRDCATKWRTAKGERHGKAKLTESQVDEIRILWATGQYTKSILGTTFGVSRAQIRRIVNREQWK